MKAVLILFALVLAGCATPPPGRNCPPLPELASRPTPAQRDVHLARVVDLYLQCAGVNP